MSGITFSIVTPSYNQGEYLAETIENVLGQEGDFAIDYLIVDGGSTDGSVEVMREYQRRLEQGEWQVKCRGISYRWLSERDAGQTDALAKGFGTAHGDILGWINSDDSYLPGALQTVVDAFRDAPESALIYGDANYCDAGGKVIGRYRTAPFDFDRLAWFNFICQPSAFFRREAFEAVGRLDPALHFAMDYDLWVRIGQRYRCRYLPRLLANYRLHESSKTVSDRTLIANCEEAEALALKHFGWAPLTRVYNTCSARCRAALPRFLAEKRAALAVATMGCALLRSVRLNRGLRLRDLALLNRENLGKLGKSRLEIMTGAIAPTDPSDPTDRSD